MPIPPCTAPGSRRGTRRLEFLMNTRKRHHPRRARHRSGRLVRRLPDGAPWTQRRREPGAGPHRILQPQAPRPPPGHRGPRGWGSGPAPAHRSPPSPVAICRMTTANSLPAPAGTDAPDRPVTTPRLVRTVTTGSSTPRRSPVVHRAGDRAVHPGDRSRQLQRAVRVRRDLRHHRRRHHPARETGPMNSTHIDLCL